MDKVQKNNFTDHSCVIFFVWSWAPSALDVTVSVKAWRHWLADVYSGRAFKVRPSLYLHHIKYKDEGW
jgi:hypothetical protein